MELIIAFLLEKGGIFGILLLSTWFWIWWTKTGRGDDSNNDKEQRSDMIDKIDLIISELSDIKQRVESLEERVSGGSSTHIEHEKVTDSVYESVEHITSLVKDLHDWHSVKDADGVPIWYVKRSLEDKVILLINAMSLDADKLSQYSQDISNLHENRIGELKEVITNYNKTILDLTMALEKVRMTLDARGDR